MHGVSAHAGLDPGKGASAIHELARLILALETLQDPSRGITVNVGVITGGTRPNVIADQRVGPRRRQVQTMADAARVEAAIRGLRPSRGSIRLEVAGGADRPRLNVGRCLRLYQQAREVAETLDGSLAKGRQAAVRMGISRRPGCSTLDGLGPHGDGATPRTSTCWSKICRGARLFWRID